MDRLRVPLRIWYAEQAPIEVRVSPPVQVKAERKFGLALAEMNRMEHLYYLAWLAASREGKEQRDFDAFLDAVVDIEPVEAEQSSPPVPESSS